MPHGGCKTAATGVIIFEVNILLVKYFAGNYRRSGWPA
jgi:hypothetical protein